MKKIEDNKLYFSTSSRLAILPEKRAEDAGFDVYAIQDAEVFTILPGETAMINTGVRSAFNENFVLLARERGSTGTKGLRLGAGVVDSGYRGDIFIPINNTSNQTIVIAYEADFPHIKGMMLNQSVDPEEILFYPKDKAIGQLIFVPIGQPELEYLSLEEFNNLPIGERGSGALGSSGK